MRLYYSCRRKAVKCNRAPVYMCACLCNSGRPPCVLPCVRVSNYKMASAQCESHSMKCFSSPDNDRKFRPHSQQPEEDGREPSQLVDATAAASGTAPSWLLRPDLHVLGHLCDHGEAVNGRLVNASQLQSMETGKTSSSSSFLMSISASAAGGYPYAAPKCATWHAI